jgi:DNA polymerase-3 subunit epsilon
VVREPRHDHAIGPFRSRADAADTADLLARFTGVRTCTARIRRAGEHGPACPEREVSPCPAPRGIAAADYAPAPLRAAALIAGDDNCALAAAVDRVGELAGRARYESAARLRDHLAAAVDVLWRGQRLRALAGVEELIAAAPDGRGGWQLAVVRHGQLAAAGVAARRVPPMPVIEALQACAQTILPRPAPLGGALVEETSLIARWLNEPGVRIVSATTGLASPLHSAGAWSQWAATARSARLAAEQLSSELRSEPHPTRQELLGGTGVERLGGAGQPVLPARQPFGVAG